jgi:CRISPR/Cas system CSM-associated protein Csm3 (group 7 of RAMP superfamily)
MSEIVYLEKLEQRYIIDLKLITKSRLHVGAYQEGIQKRIVWLNVNGKLLPVIPAESLKGSFRKLATKIAKNLDFGDQEVNEVVKYHREDKHSIEKNNVKLYPKFIEADDGELKKDRKKELEIIFSEEQLGELSKDAQKELYLSLKCPICKLFGSQRLTGKMIFSDAILIDEPRIDIYTSTSISRETKTVEEERLFSLESLESNLRFEAKVIVDNVMRGSDEALLLSKLFEYILKLGGFQIGGAKSRGFGQVAISEDSKVYIHAFKKPKTNEEVYENIMILLGKKFEIKNINEFIVWLMQKY